MSGFVSGQPVVLAPPSSLHDPQGTDWPGRLVPLHSFALVLSGRMDAASNPAYCSPFCAFRHRSVKFGDPTAEKSQELAKLDRRDTRRLAARMVSDPVVRDAEPFWRLPQARPETTDRRSLKSVLPLESRRKSKKICSLPFKSRETAIFGHCPRENSLRPEDAPSA